MSTKGGNELEKSSSRKRPKGAASVAQEAAAAPTPAPAATTATAAASASTGEKWSAENGLLLLKTFLRILEDRGERPSYEQIHEAMHGSIPDDISKEKVGDKLRNLKRRFLRAQARAAPPVYDPFYQISEKIWGGTAEAEAPAAVTPKAKPTPKPKTVKTPDVVASQEEEETPAAATLKAKPSPKKKTQKPPTAAAPQEEQEVPLAVTPKAKPVPKRKAEKTPATAAPEEEHEVPPAVTPKAKPTPKRKADKKPPQEEQEASEVEEDTERPRKSPLEYDNTPVAKPAPKRKKKKTSDAAAPEEEAKVAGEDARNPQMSPGDHNTTPALRRPKKEKAKSQPLELVATGRSSSELREVENRHMLASGMVRILQQVYPEADEKLVLWTLDSMEGPDFEEIKEKWRQLQEMKLQVASLTAQLVMKLTRAPH